MKNNFHMDSIIVFAPGRINIIGEHTDYNGGLVLPAAIDKGTTFNIKKTSSENIVRCKEATEASFFSFNLENCKPTKSGWQDYVIGVVQGLLDEGATLTGFEAVFSGDVPIGAGMSSSASLECSLAYGLNLLFDLKLDDWKLIKICQLAEHHFVGTQCGIMDQFASIFGRKDQVMLLDCESQKFNYYECELGNYKFVLLNTNVSHSLADSEYNKRRSECESAFTILKTKLHDIATLSNVSIDQLEHHKELLSKTQYKRCHHVLSENARVLEATEALNKKDLKTLGALLYQSHSSLKNDYNVSCTELDFLVDSSKPIPYVMGSRMMGGGFGGCTINLVKSNHVEEFITTTKKKFLNKFKTPLSAYLVSIGEGARLIS